VEIGRNSGELARELLLERFGVFHFADGIVDFGGVDSGRAFQPLDVPAFGDAAFGRGLGVFEELRPLEESILQCQLYPRPSANT
jgi:hypothetical protein